jgi:protein-disulfide isomerase
MELSTVRRLGVPLVIAAALVLSYRKPAPAPLIELEPGVPTGPSVQEIEAAWRTALAPGAPGYEHGAASAPVTVVEFSDFGCRYCARFVAETYPALHAAFVQAGRVRWRTVPFVMGIFPGSEAAVRAAVCAGEQGRPAYQRMHDRLYARQSEWVRADDPAALFRGYATAAGLDAARFGACWASDAPDARIREANDLADRMGVRATPTFFINGARLEGALPTPQFRSILDDELSRAR